MSENKDENLTLSRNNPITEFIRSGNFTDSLSQKETESKFSEFLSEKNKEKKKNNNNNNVNTGTERDDIDNIKESKSSSSSSSSLSTSNNNNSIKDGPIDRIVLKFTTISEVGAEAPSFVVNKNGASIGRDSSNEVCVPSDLKMSEKSHSKIEYDESTGSFNLIDCGEDNGASIRISSYAYEDPTTLSKYEISNGKNGRWLLPEFAKFSAGNSIFMSNGVDKDGKLLLEVIDGPCRGQKISVGHEGACIGRSSENLVAVPDRELSRKHSRIMYDEKHKCYHVTDCGSTNGTYIMLNGPYEGPYKLSLNDHILVARTGFSVNRFDYGISEEMGMRQTMEDSCVIVQHLNVAPLNVLPLTPQSFFGVFDGHGGVRASRYLSQKLHVNVAAALLNNSNTLLQVAAEGIQENTTTTTTTSSSSSTLSKKFDNLVEKLLFDVFLETDRQFIEGDKDNSHGSTATTALMLGNRLYCANVGDSRVLLSRAGGTPLLLTIDQKPSRADEAKRIRDAGGFIINNRVMGELAISRAFGDADFKRSISAALQDEGVDLPVGAPDTDFDQPLITALPEIQIVDIEPTDEFLVLACDGLFDVFESIEIVEFVKEEMLEHGDVQKCAASLTHEAIRKRNSRDNVSVIIIILNDSMINSNNNR